MLDSEPEVMDRVRGGPSRNLFDFQNLISGLDGTGGEQPRYTNVYGNIVLEIGPKCTIIGISWSTMVDFTTIHG